jgi:hypothetical protein
VLLDRGWRDSEPAVVTAVTTADATITTDADSSSATAQPLLAEQCSSSHDTDIDNSSSSSNSDATATPTQWDCQWSGARAAVEVLRFTKRLAPWQRVNHFRNSKELCRKDLMLKNIQERSQHTLHI